MAEAENATAKGFVAENKESCVAFKVGDRVEGAGEQSQTFGVGDVVKLARRKEGNKTGILNFSKLNGDVGRICHITDIGIDRQFNKYRLAEKSTDKYVGWFDADDLEPVDDCNNTTTMTKSDWLSESSVENLQKTINKFYELSMPRSAFYANGLDPVVRVHWDESGAWEKGVNQPTKEESKPKKLEKFMTDVKDFVKKKAMNEDTQALYDAGLVDIDGDLTNRGADALEEVQL